MADGLLALSPLSYWALDTMSGTTAVNSKSGGVSATLRNGAVFSANGTKGRGVTLDGVNDMISVNHAPAYASANGAIGLWFKPDALGSPQGLVSKNNAGLDAGGGFTALLQADGSILFTLESASASFTITSSTAATAGAWNNLVISWGAGGMQVWLNGALVGGNAYTGGLVGADDPLVFGASTADAADNSLTGATNFFKGGIDEAVVFTRQPTAAEISALNLNGSVQGNASPAAAADALGLLENAAGPVSGNVLSNDTDANSEALSVFAVNGVTANVGVAVSGAYGVITVAADGTYSYTLNSTASNVQALRQGQVVTETFVYTATDGRGGLSTANLIITITGQNDVPVVTAEARIITEDPGAPTLTGNVLSNDRDLDGGTLTVSAVNGIAGDVGATIAAAYGTMNIAANGAYTYTLSNAAPVVQALKAGQIVTDTITYTVSDGQGGTSTTSIVVSVTGKNDTPVVTVDSGAAAPGTSPTATGNVLANDVDADGDTLSVTAVKGLAANVGATVGGIYGSLLLNADGTWTYTVNADAAATRALAPGQTATDTFAYTARDGAASASSSLVITVTGSNDTMTLVADARTITEDPAATALTGNVLSNDSDPDGGVLSVTAVNGAPGNVGAVLPSLYGEISIAANGAYTYTLNNASAAVQALKAGQIATEVFIYTASDGQGGVASSTVTITITGKNDAPTLVADMATVGESASQTAAGNVLTNDVDIDGNSLVVSAVKGSAANVGAEIAGAYGTLRLNGDGTYTYTLNTASAAFIQVGPGQTATDTFAYTASDGTSAVSSSLVITVRGFNDQPTAVADVRTIAEDPANNILTGNLVANDTDPDNGTVLVVAQVNGVTMPAGSLTTAGTYGTLVVQEFGAYTYTLNNASAAVQGLRVGQTATETFTYQSTDESGGFSTTTLTITIAGKNDAPTLTADTGAADAASAPVATGNVLVNDTDIDGDTLAVSAVKGSAANVGANVNGTYGALRLNADGTYTYTLNPASAALVALAPGAAATESFAYTASDGAGGSATSSIAFTVTGANDAPRPVNDARSTNEDTGTPTLTGNVLANDTDPDGGVVTLTGVAGSAANLGVAQAGTYGSLTLNADGTYAYTLANASPAVQTLRVGQIVTDTFAYAVADGQGGSAMANIVVSIAGRNDAPTVTSAVTASVLEDATLSAAGSVFTTARDIDVGDTLSVDRVNGQATSVGVSIAGTYGSIVIGQDGQYVYTLNNAAVNVQALNAGQTVTDSFTYRLVDGSGGVVNNTLVVSVAGRDENRPPVAANDAVAGSEDVAATFDPRANDSDPDSNSLTVTQIASQAITAGQTVQLPGGHAATLNANGTITLVPAANYNGPVLFVYTISDGQGATASATATVTFSPVNDAPTIQILAGDTASTTILDTAGSAATFTSFLGSVYVSDVDLGDVSFSGSATLNSSTNGAALGIFGGAGGGPGVSAAIWVYNIPGSVLDSLGAGQTVVETGTLFVFDGNGGTATLPISVTLVGANDVPTIANALTAQSAAEDAVFSFQVPAGVFADADNGDVLSYTATLSNGSVLPTWLSFNPATRTFLGTPAQADVANLTIRVTASDGNGGVVFDEFALNVAGTNDAPNAVNDVASTSEDISVTINVLANDTDPDAGEVLSVSEIGGQAVTSGQAVTLAGGAQATLNAGGTITYAPAANVSGPATFTYTVSDGQGGSASASVTVDVAPAAAAAIIGFGGGPLSPIQAFDVPIPSSATGPEGAAGIANTADGFAVIWYSLQGSVNIQRYSAQGENIGSTAIVNPSTAGQARYAGIAGLADGGTIVVWAAGDIRAQRFDASGSPVGASEFLVNTVSGNLRGSTVTALNDGGFAITWIAEGQGGPGFGIYTQRFTAGGAKAGNETRVNTSAATEVAVRSAALEGGGYVVSWSSPGADGHDMYTQRFNAAGVPVGAELRVNTTTPNNQYWAAVAGLNGGGFVIGWSSDGQDGSGFGSYAQRFDANGTPVGGEIPLNTYTAGNQTQPMIAALADGGFVASWTSNGQDGSGRGIFAQRFDAAGVRVGGEERLNATTANDQYNDTNGGGAHLIAMPGGLLAQVFVGDGAAGNIYFRQFDTRLGFEGSEDGAIPLPITVAAEPGDSIAQVVLSGLPAGSVLSAGTSNGDGTAWTFAGAPPANLTLTPPTNFNGAFSLTVTATTQDGADTQTSSASRSVTVSAVNDLPVAVNNSATTAEDTPVTIDVLSNDSDPDAGNVLSVGQIDGQNVIAGQTLTLAGGAQATLNANGTITYAPATNANGAASFAYTVSDGQGGTASATANITVTPVAADASIVFSSGPGLGPIDAGLVRVNATASVGIYNESSVAALSGGGFVVTWTRGAPDGTVGVRSQRFDAAGSPVGVETLVNSSPDGLQLQPTVTSLPDGGHVIAWLSYNQIGQAGEVYARRYDASGVAIGPEFRVNATTAGEQGFPDVVALAGGGFVIGFSGTDAADNGVWVRIFDAAGGSIGGDIKLNQGAPGAQNSPRIAALADGGFVAAWFAPDADTTGIYARRFDASGAPAGNEFPVSSYVAGEQLDAHIATLSGGGFVIVWGSLAQDGSGYGIYAQRYDASGIADGSEFRLNQTTGGNQFEPSIAEMPDGGFVASWRSAAQGQVLRRFGADGLPIGDEFVVSGVIHNNESEGGLAVLADGVVIQTVAGGGLVYIRRYAAADTFAGAEDGSISLPITVAAEPGDSVAQIVLSGLPVGSVLSAGMSNGDGSVWTFAGSPPATLTLTPPANYNGAFTLTVTATTQDGASTATSVATRTVAITAVNDAPVAANDTASVNEDGSVVISLLTNDADVDGDTLAVTQIDGQAAAVGVAVNLASGGTATRSADNTITYAPAANANGQKAFSYTISDGNGGSDTASVTVDVARAADPAGISFGGIAPIDLNDARVNTTTANTQSFSAVSPLPGGGHVVVWRSVSAAGGTPPNELCDIYMQLYDAAGAPAGGEVRVNATFPGLTLQTFPGVATLADGSFVITWSLYTGPTNTFEIWARRFNADGTPLLNAGSPTTGEFIVTNPNSPPFQFLSTIAALPDGSFVIAWESGSSASGFDIRFQRFDASNAPAGGPVTVNQLASGNAFNEYADIAVLGDGSFVIAWETSPIYASANSTANTDVVGRRFSSAGAPMGDEFVISTTTTESQTKPDVAALAGGGFVVTWTSYRQAGADQGADVYMQRYDSAGVRVGGETLINLDTAGGQGFSTVQSLADGGFVVTWASGASLLNDGVSDGTANLVAQRFDAAGVRIGGEVRINAATAGQQWTESWASDSAFTVTPEGVLVHTFYGDGEVYVRRFDTNVFGGAEDGLIRLPVTVAAEPGDSIAQVVLSGLPAGSVLSAGSSSNGGTTWTFASAPPANLTLTAPANYNGAFTLTVTATTQDGTDTDTTTATQTVTVTAVNDAPTASNDAASIGEDSTAALTGNVLTNDGDVDLDTLTVSAGTGARTSAYGTLTLNANGSYSYALNTAAVQALGASDTATDSFTYQVSDGQGGAAQAALTITIQGADDPAFSIQRISTDAAGAQGNSSSEQPAISADGRYVTFLSYASNLVAGDTNNTGDIFRKDLQTGAITRVSTDTAGVQANNFSEQPAISADGRYVTFQSYASNLVPGDTNGQPDIFRKDLQTGAITRVSTDAAGAQANTSSEQHAISADGRYVTFLSFASNLVAGDTDNTIDIFRKDLQTGAITRVSTDAAGAQGNNASFEPAISADGRYVTFYSSASNLVAGDTNGQPDIFRKDLQTGAITRVSTDASGAQGNTSSFDPGISSDGRYVTFSSNASNLVAGDTNNTTDIYRKDLQTGAIVRVSSDASGAQGNNTSSGSAISSDGRYVTFYSSASNLVAGDTNNLADIFRKDLQTGAITRVSTDAAGVQGNNISLQPAISADGRYVTFRSDASNLVAGDTNAPDIFVVDLPPPQGDLPDIATGASSADRIVAYAGPQILTGGAGADSFIFATPAAGGDTITDFAPGSDRIEVSASGFGGGLAAGPLPGSSLVSGAAPAATLASGQFLYNTGSGQLSWDADGTGGGAAVLLAALSGAPAITSADIGVVASLPPLILDLDGNGVELVSGVSFDFDGDGNEDTGGWASAGDAFLALDRNGDGLISTGSEISFAGDLPGATSDLDGLRAFDSNGDGALSAADAQFAKFLVWRDADGDGVSDAGELRSLAEAGVVSIGLDRYGEASTGPAGDILGYATVTMADGASLRAADVVLNYTNGESDLRPTPHGSAELMEEHAGSPAAFFVADDHFLFGPLEGAGAIEAPLSLDQRTMPIDAELIEDAAFDFSAASLLVARDMATPLTLPGAGHDDWLGVGPAFDPVDPGSLDYRPPEPFHDRVQGLDGSSAIGPDAFRAL